MGQKDKFIKISLADPADKDCGVYACHPSPLLVL